VKGILPCGSVIAVKKFHDTILASDNDRSFQDEASFLMDIEHQNIIQLLGFCAESRGAMMMKQPNGKVVVVEQLTRMLCFEYMCNGGLHKHLSGTFRKHRHNLSPFFFIFSSLHR
jgi:serine/threonine protein kinase